MNSPNILITNYCNQGCTYCFASSLMKDVKIPKEMTLSNFKLLVHKLKQSKNNIDTIKLLGGEPTLHSQFEEMVTYALENFKNIQLFTNGLFSEKTLTFLKKQKSKINYTFNVSTPGFLYNEKNKELILRAIKTLGQDSSVALSLTVLPSSGVDILIKSLTKQLVQDVNFIRLGVANPILGQKESYSFDQYQKIGKNIVHLVKKIRLHNKKAEISLNCGFVRCMFTQSDLLHLKNQKIVLFGWGCFGKNSAFDIKTNLQSVLCYSTSELKKVNMLRSSVNSITKNLYLHLALYHRYWELKMCKKCPHFGFDRKQCPGPCVAYKHQLSKKSN